MMIRYRLLQNLPAPKYAADCVHRARTSRGDAKRGIGHWHDGTGVV